MKFSRAVALSSALFASSAAAFSIPTTSSAPKTALFASSHDEGVLERRQVLASLAATTAVTLGVTAANALTGDDIKQGAKDAAGNIKGNVDSISGNNNMGMGGMGKNMNMGGMGKNMDMGGMGKNMDMGGMGKNMDMGGMGKNMDMNKNLSMGNNMGMNNPVEKAKSAADSLNPFSGGNDAGRKANDVVSQGKERGRDIAMKGKEIADKASNNSGNPFQGNKNPADNANNPFSGMKNQGGNNMNNMNPFDNKNMMNKDNNPMSNKNPMNRSGISNNMPNMPNSPGDASNKLKDAGNNLFSTAQKATSSNL